MNYKTAAAFRQALETRLLDRSRNTSVPLVRLRKMVAFDRLLARLVKQKAGSWIVKGGFALQLRLGNLARTTKDIDVAATQELDQEKATARIQKGASLDMGDWFEFEVGQPEAAATGAAKGGLQFPIRCLLDGRRFESFHLDLGIGDAVADKPEKLTGPRLLSFAAIRPARVPCYPLTSQISEKVHAYTRPYAAGESSRVRDLVDILLIASIARLNSRKLSNALKITFEVRSTHDLPKELPQPPAK